MSKKRDRDNIYKLPLGQGLFDQIPGIAPFDYTEPVINARDTNGNPLTQYDVNRTYNNKRYAINLDGTFRAILLTPYQRIEVTEDSEDNWGVVDYVSSVFNNSEESDTKNIIGYYNVRVPTVHDGVLPIPDPELIGTERYNLIASMYPKAFVYESLKITAGASYGTIVEVQALDVNRNNYKIVSLIRKGSDFGLPTVPPAAPTPVGTGTPNQTTNAPLDAEDPCADNGNVKGATGKPISELHHALKDFIPSAADGPFQGNAANTRAGSPPCLRIPPTNREGGRGSAQHKGIDLGVAEGTGVYAPADGVVERISTTGTDTPNHIVVLWHPRTENAGLDSGDIDGEKLYTRYLHLSRIDVSLGQQVQAGDLIGATGDIGSPGEQHLHYEIRFGTGPQLANLGAVIPPFRQNADADIPPESSDYANSSGLGTSDVTFEDTAESSEL